MEKLITRFAPSPTGYLHLGHAYSALFAYNFARAQNGTFLLRIEDIDPVRCKPAYTEEIYEDLSWLGLAWPKPVRVQSDHYADYRAALKKLEDMGVLYPCFCSRKDIQEEVARAGYAPHGPEGPVYPGTCKALSPATRADYIAAGKDYALRLNLENALSIIDPKTLFWHEGEQDIQTAAKPDILGDIVLARKDIGTSYHLSVVVDDALQNVTHIIRGQDLQHTTHIHRVLQELLGCSRPHYHHHKLLTDQDGKRFAKRDGSVTLRQLKEQGHSPADIYQMIKTLR